jgi:hypothetical protein
MKLLLAVLLSLGGAAIFLLTFWWEHSWFKNLGARGSVLPSQLANTLERHRRTMDWVRVIGAIVLLIGLLLGMLG